MTYSGDVEASTDLESGNYTGTAYNTNADGQSDYVEVDTNADGLADVMIGDTNYDGIMDTAIADTDYDGVADTGYIDLTGDEVPDVVYTPDGDIQMADLNTDGVSTQEEMVLTQAAIDYLDV